MRRTVAAAAAALLLAPAAAAAPKVAIFYYPWYGNPARDGAYQHWNQAGHQPPQDVAAAFYPARGAYSSSSPALVAAQMDDIRAAHVDEVVASWWGPGSVEAARLGAVAAAARARGIEVAVHVEPYPGRTPAAVAADVEELRTLGIRDFYVFRPQDFAPEEWAPALATLSGVRVFAQTNHVGFALHGGFSGVYTYDIVTFRGRMFARYCDQAHAVHLLCGPSVGPGFDSTRTSPTPIVQPRLNGLTYDHMWTCALRAHADFVTVTSYNEWGEGTQIEPAGRGNGPIGYKNYDGAYGRHGVDAERAYVDRTAYWADRFRAVSP